MEGVSGPSFGRRMALGFSAFRRILSDRAFAARLAQLVEKRPEPISQPQTKVDASDGAMQLLGLFQRDGRLIDFLREDVAAYSDAEVGAAVRVVHEGCRKALDEHFRLEPIHQASEGERVDLKPGFDATAIRVTGNVSGEPPFTGTLTHRGWRAAEVKLPKLSPEHDVTVLAAAEVEL